MESWIIHLDMDAFFAAVEQRDNPGLVNRPVIVGADPKKGRGRGVVSTCSYEARKFGIRSGLAISAAYKKCPQGVFLPVDMEKYQAVSDKMYEILDNFTPQVEPVGIDEAFLDISASLHLFGGVEKTCLRLKEQIKKELRLTASIGCAPNKMAAKIASELKKPDGLVIVSKNQLLDFIYPLEIERISGLGQKSASLLKAEGIKTIGDLAVKNPEDLVRKFGKIGLNWWELANGCDQRPVVENQKIKSVSNEVTFQEDTKDRELLLGTLLGLSEKVSRRLRQENLKVKTIALKIRLADFKTYSRSQSLIAASNSTSIIYQTVKKLYLDFNPGRQPIRLLGIKGSNCLDADFKDSFFSEEKDKRKQRVDKTTDWIKDKFGETAIYRAGSKFNGFEA
ncbi:MAG: DNA polymerase IV [Candidatus Omnitrophica bacterium]|nr:DNA polymerase IV [Candidatus Omnitrophota bacterium]